MSVVLVTIQMPVATQNTLEVICDESLDKAFTFAAMGLQLVVAAYCLMRNGSGKQEEYQSFINEPLDIPTVVIADANGNSMAATSTF